MDRADLVNRLKWVLADVRGGTRAAVNEAIALIEPQPVTEAGLREAGFEDESGGSMAFDLGDGTSMWIQYRSGQFFLWCVGDRNDLHITDMQQLRSVIAALRGQA